jgi:predicted nucleic acid-binding protein
LSAFLDTNVPLYATGKAHPLKAPCADIIRMVAMHQDAFITDAEVLQEILHRFISVRLWPDRKAMFTQFANLMRGRTLPILAQDVELAAELAEAHPRTDARDVIHLAVMRRLGVKRIISADRGFDGVPDVERLDPARFEEWRATVTS